MGVDWHSLGWQEYQVTLAGWNAAHDTDKPAPDLDRLKRFTAAHTLQ